MSSRGSAGLGRGVTRSRRRRRWSRVFGALSGGVAFAAFAVITVLLVELTVAGAPHLSGTFFVDYASRFPERAGIRAPLLGSFWILGLTAVIAVPVSVGAAVYLEEYGAGSWMTRLAQTSIASLAGIPSIIYGIVGLALFVRSLGLGRSVLAGALTLSVLVMPLIVQAAQEALRAVPAEVREAAYALGATRWDVVRRQVLPAALPGILSGAMLALARAVGETAPLIMIGAMGFIAFTPEGIGDSFTVLPIQIFDWVSRPQADFRGLAAAASLVLLAMVFGLSMLGVLLRSRLRRRIMSRGEGG